MRVKEILYEDFVNYKKPSMFIGAISCGGKCCTEAGLPLSVCHNDGWRESATVVVKNYDIIQRYLSNPITKAIVFGGLEPFEQYEEILEFIHTFRIMLGYLDDIVIYTGYKKEEVKEKVDYLTRYINIIIKFGRYIPNRPSRYDEVLGVTLASDNQYAERIS